jgi:hypothetical protein
MLALMMVKIIVSAGCVGYSAYTMYKIYRSETLKRCISLSAPRSVASRMLEYSRYDPPTPARILRSVFRETLTPAINPSNPSHTHPESGASRSSCTVFAKHIAAKAGIKPFIYQASPLDVKNGYNYSRDFHWAKDVMVPYSNALPDPSDLLTIVDVDYYRSIAGLLLNHDGPVLLYTFQPTKAATSSGEFSFTFDAGGVVTYSVSGGACYSHSVWNYGVDVISVTERFSTKYYIVERRKANEHHEYILMLPIGSWYGLFAILAKYLSASSLERLQPIQGDFIMLDVQTSTGLQRSVARVGEHNCATIPMDTFDALRSVNKNNATRIGNATIDSWVDDRHAASVLTDYFRSLTITSQPAAPPVVYPAIVGIKKYQIVKRVMDYVPDCSAYMVSFMSPVYPRVYVPDKSRNNDLAAVRGRILIPQAEAESLAQKPPSAWLVDAMVDFAAILIPEELAFEASPVSVDEVYLRQNRPSQRALLNQADSMLPVRKAKTFLKAEPYQKPSSPRIISTYNSVDKREYSRYIYALSDHIKEEDWYSFGKSPKVIAGRVAEICKSVTSGVACADAERMDGHIHELVRDFERIVLTRFFKPEYHSDVCDLHSSQYQIDAKTTLGVKYTIDYQRGSGSPETAVFNTLLSKFMDFLARLRVGATPLEAYMALGQFGGDDSITPELMPGVIGGKIITEVAALLGQKLEVDEFMINKPGVVYLSRTYWADVWYGNDNSFCDLKRTLSKLHVSANMTGFTPIVKLQQKLSGLALSDAHTPIITTILKTAYKLGLPLNLQYVRGLSSWWSQYDVDVNWPNRASDDESHHIATYVGDVDVIPLYKYLADCKRPEDLLTMPAICDAEEVPKVKEIVVVDEIVVKPIVPQPLSSGLLKPVVFVKAGEQVGSRGKGVCDKYIRRECKDRNCKFEHVQVCNKFLKGEACAKNCKFRHYKPKSL